LEEGRNGGDQLDLEDNIGQIFYVSVEALSFSASSEGMAVLTFNILGPRE